MRRNLAAAAFALGVAALGLLAACPSLDVIHVGSGDSATDSHVPPNDVPVAEIASADGGDAAMDAPCLSDVAADPHNCGACGHDCLGGNCANGACLPVVVFHGDTPSGISVDGPNLFVTVDVTDQSDGYLFRCQTANCQDTEVVLARGLANPWFPAERGGTIYWVNGGTEDGGVPGTVQSCPGDGCADAGPASYGLDGGVEGGGAQLSGLALDSTFVYWGEVRFEASITGRIDRCAASDCDSTFIHLVSGAQSLPYAVAVDPAYVYWTDLGTNQVARCTLPSCSNNPEIVAGNLNSPTGLAIYGGNVYWAEGTDPGGRVAYCPTAGCGMKPTTLAKDQPNPYAVVADESGVYWTNIDDGTVMRCPLESCPKPVVLASAPAAFAIALDEVSVYFTSSTVSGEVLRVAK